MITVKYVREATAAEKSHVDKVLMVKCIREDEDVQAVLKTVEQSKGFIKFWVLPEGFEDAGSNTVEAGSV